MELVFKKITNHFSSDELLLDSDELLLDSDELIFLPRLRFFCALPLADFCKTLRFFCALLLDFDFVKTLRFFCALLAGGESVVKSISDGGSGE
jgi:hypothetical protein